MNKEYILKLLTNILDENKIEESAGQLANLLAYNNVELDYIIQLIEENFFDKEKLLNLLAIIFWQFKYFDYVIPLLQKCYDYNSNNNTTLYNMGYILSALDELEQSLFYLTKINPRDKDTEQLIHEINIKLNIPTQDDSSQYPLVSILIPTYNRPYYLKLALESALNQTYPNIEIIIGDNSTNSETKDMLSPFLEKYNNIQYYKNETDVGGFVNMERCFEHSSGDYINYLMDDDLFHPEKIYKMIPYLQEHPDVNFITSLKQLIDQEGNNISTSPPISSKTTKLSGNELINYVISNCHNIIGEPTTVLFRKKALTETFGNFHGKLYEFACDVASWISMLSAGNAIYISEILSYTRIHNEQAQQLVSHKAKGVHEWLSLIIESKKNGFLQDEVQFKKALIGFIKYSSDVIYSSIEKQELQTLADAGVKNSILESINLLFD